MNEIWKDIERFEEVYQVSNMGKVKSKDRIVKSRYNKPIFGKVLNLIKTTNGYMCVNLKTAPLYKQFLVHRLVGEAFIPNPNNKPQINHIDGNKENNLITNLEWCTGSENQIHAHKIGLTKSNLKPRYGIKNNMSKLSYEIAEEIRTKYNEGNFNQYELATIYNVNQQTIWSIIHRKSWKTLT